MTASVVAPDLLPSQEQAWHALFDFAAQCPDGWTVVGGQMAHLHAWERRLTGPRPTVDIDAGLGFRGHPRIGGVATGALRSLGFSAAVTAIDGPAVRWVRDCVEIDVVVPVGRRRPTVDVHARRLLESHGIQQALDRSEVVLLTVGERTASIRRPRLYAAVVAKAAALANVGDSRRDRHLDDLVTLLGLLTAVDVRLENPTGRDYRHLDLAHKHLVDDLRSTRNTPEVRAAFDLLTLHDPR